MIESVRYVRLGTPRLHDAGEFAREILGLACHDRGSAHVAFGTEGDDPSVIFVEGDAAYQIVGLQLSDGVHLPTVVERLSTAGYRACRGASGDAELRRCQDVAFVTDGSGNRFELVVRSPMSDRGSKEKRRTEVIGLQGVALRSRVVNDDLRFWVELLDAKVRDRVSDNIYLNLDMAHHRVAIHPAIRMGVIALEFAVEGLDEVMRRFHFLQRMGMEIVHGPGLRPVSGQAFVTFRGTGDTLFSFVSGGRPADPVWCQRPRKFASVSQSFDAWGSRCDIPEFAAAALTSDDRACQRRHSIQ